MNAEVFTKVLDAVNTAMKNGYYPEEDILNAPRLRVVPTKLRYMARTGCAAIHMNSDSPHKEPFSIAIA